MTRPKFLQIHTLTSYPGTLLNRDDAGFAKRLPFGGATRTRVSSQCLKFHWRNHDGEHALYGMDVDRSLRSRRTFEFRVAEPLVEQGYPPALVNAGVITLRDLLLSDDKVSKTQYKKILSGEEDELNTSQVTILGEPEVRYLRQLLAETMDELRDELSDVWSDPEPDFSGEQIDSIVKAFTGLAKGDIKKNLRGLELASGLDAALFGRMTTSDALARGDAAIHVAHAFTTHEQENESDYFSAVDELVAASGEGELGGGHINSSELTSGLFYGYVVVDVPLLVSNLEGCGRDAWEEADTTLARSVIQRMIRLISTVSPGAKLGSTAPYARAEMVLVEAGSGQPRTLANAFRKPVDPRPDVLNNSFAALGRYLSQMDQMYGDAPARSLSAIGPTKGLADAVRVDTTVPVSETAEWAASQVGG